MSFSQLEQVHYKQIATPQGQRYEDSMLAEHNRHWARIQGKCAPAARDAGIVQFDSVTIIDSKGGVIAYRTNPENVALECFREEVSRIKYPKPPYAVFHELMSIGLEGTAPK